VASHPVQYQAPLFRRLAARPEIDIHVAYCGLQGAEAAHDPEFETTVKWDVPVLSGYPWSHIANKGSGRLSFLGLYNPGLWKFIRTGNYDAVISFVGYVRATFWIAYFAAKKSKAAFLFGTDATTLASRNGRTWKRTLKKFLWPRLFRLADQIIVPSTGSQNLMHSLGLPRDRITLTPYTVDNDWWIEQSQRIDRSAVRASWGATEENTVVLFCAKLQPWKRPLDLVRAFAKAAVPGAFLVIAGDGPQRAELEREARDLGLAERVRILGFVNLSRLPGLYKASDLFVLPSEYDPCPLVVPEAMLSGLPVILSDAVLGRLSMINPEISGYTYPCGNAHRLANILRTVLNDPALLNSLKDGVSRQMESWRSSDLLDASVLAIEKAIQRVREFEGRDT